MPSLQGGRGSVALGYAVCADVGGAHKCVCSKLRGGLGTGCAALCFSALFHPACHPLAGWPWLILLANIGILERVDPIEHVTSPSPYWLKQVTRPAQVLGVGKQIPPRDEERYRVTF